MDTSAERTQSAEKSEAAIRRRKRRSPQEKLQIVRETLQSQESVAVIARRHGVNANHPYASASQGDNKNSGRPKSWSREKRLSIPMHARGGLVPLLSGLRKGCASTTHRDQGRTGGPLGSLPVLPLARTSPRHDLGTRRRPTQTEPMARLPRGETQHGEGSARGRIEIDSSMLEASGNDGQSNRVDFAVPALDLSSVIAAQTNQTAWPVQTEPDRA